MSVQESIAAIAKLASKRAKKIQVSDLSAAGKLQPAQGGKLKQEKCGCGKSADATCECDEPSPGDDVAKNADLPETAAIFVAIAKANEEQQTVTGIVLQPEVTDAQGDIYSAEIVRESAYAFLANFNKQTKLGLQHSTFPKNKLALVESYIAPISFALNTYVIKEGSWVMTVKVLDNKLWLMVKAGKIKGFSIGGKAKVKDLVPAAGALT